MHYINAIIINILILILRVITKLSPGNDFKHGPSMLPCLH